MRKSLLLLLLLPFVMSLRGVRIEAQSEALTVLRSELEAGFNACLAGRYETATLHLEQLRSWLESPTAGSELALTEAEMAALRALTFAFLGMVYDRHNGRSRNGSTDVVPYICGSVEPTMRSDMAIQRLTSTAGSSHRWRSTLRGRST